MNATACPPGASAPVLSGAITTRIAASWLLV